MIRIFTLTLIAISCSFFSIAQNKFVDNGSSTSFTLRTGDSLIIKSGRFTGSINSWEKGVHILVTESAEFAPSSLGYYQGTLTIFGRAVIPSLDGQSDHFELRNSGRTVVNGNSYFGNNASIHNNFGALLELNGDVNSNKINLTNVGTIRMAGNWYLGNNSKLTNTGRLDIAGNVELNASHITNSGQLIAGQKLTISNGDFANNCRVTAGNKMQINGAVFTNNGMVWIKASGSDPLLENNGTIDGKPGSTFKSVNFANNKTITGSGYYYFTGNTSHNAGSIGTNGNNDDAISVYDATRTNPATIFDAQSGNVRRSVSFAALSAPDTLGISNPCGSGVAEGALPVKWNYFNANANQQQIILNWSAEQDNGTKFEVERSLDNRTYSTIHSFVADFGATKFTYTDAQAGTNSQVVYYRIRAIEPTG